MFKGGEGTKVRDKAARGSCERRDRDYPRQPVAPGMSLWPKEGIGLSLRDQVKHEKALQPLVNLARVSLRRRFAVVDVRLCRGYTRLEVIGVITYITDSDSSVR